MKFEIELTNNEAKVLRDFCAKKDLDKNNVMRQALRIYQLFDEGILIKDETHPLYQGNGVYGCPDLSD